MLSVAGSNASMLRQRDYMKTPQTRYPREALKEWWSKITGNPPVGDEIDLHGLLVDVLFFASLGKEEGRPTLVRIVYHEEGVSGVRVLRDTSPENRSIGFELAWEVIPIEPIEFSVKALIKIAPATGPLRTALIVGPHRESEQLRIEGFARRVEGTNGGKAAVISAVAPGSLVTHYEGDEVFRYEQGYLIPTPPDVLSVEGVVRDAIKSCAPGIIGWKRIFPFSFSAVSDIERVLFRLLQRMSATRKGGIISLLPGCLSEETLARVKYRIPASERSMLSSKLRAYNDARNISWTASFNFTDGPVTGDDAEEWEAARESVRRNEMELHATIDDIGQLTVVDDALLLGPDLEVIGAGYSIPSSNLPPTREAKDPQGTHLEDFQLARYGSRHRAAACFAYDNPGGISFIASEDGPMRCMLRPKDKDEVIVWSIRLPDF